MLNRTSSGLISKETFSSVTGWTSSAGFTAGSNPGLVIFGALPIDTLVRTPSGVDDQGCREAHLFIDGDWRNLALTRHLFYGSGSQGGADAPWRPHLANSTNGGKTFTKLGSWGPGLSDGTSGTYSARDMLYIEKRGSTYVMHAMIGAYNFGGGIPGPPYTSDLWTINDLANFTNLASWNFVRYAFPVGAPGTFDEGSAYAGQVVLDGSTYRGFYSTANGNYTIFNVGLANATSPTGVFTKTNADVLPDGNSYGENPKIWWSSVLNKWVMLQNRAVVAGYTDQSVYFLSNSLTDWSASSPIQIHRPCPLDGDIAVGIISPYFVAEGAAVETAEGYVPVTWDGWPQDAGPINVHLHRKIVSGVVEPSPYALVYSKTGQSGVTNTFEKSVPFTDGTIEWAARFSETAGGAFHAFDYRVQAEGDGYRVVLAIGEKLKLQKSSGGTFSDIAPGSGTLNGAQGMMHRLRVRVVGNVHALWLDGEQQVSFTDSSSPFISGVKIRFVAKDANQEARLCHIRSADTVTVNGLTDGQAITLRAPGTPPIATATVSGTSHTFSGVAHFPAESIEIDGVNNVVPGGIWGGDIFTTLNNVVVGGSFPGGFARRI